MKNNIESPVYMLAISALFLLALPAFAQQPIANSLVGSTDIPAYIEEALGLAASLAETAQRAFGNDLLQPDHQAMDDFYRPVEEKYRRVQQQYEDFYKKKMDGAGPDMEAMNREIERNPIVKNMGGYRLFIAASAHKVNGNPADLYNGANTEFNLAGFEATLLGLGLDLIKKSRELTWSVAGWERNYQEVRRSYGGGN